MPEKNECRTIEEIVDHFSAYWNRLGVGEFASKTVDAMTPSERAAYTRAYEAARSGPPFDDTLPDVTGLTEEQILLLVAGQLGTLDGMRMWAARSRRRP